MSHEVDTISVQVRRLLLYPAQKLLPRARRKEILKYLEQLHLPTWQLAAQTLHTIVAEYRNQTILAFDVLTLALQAAGTAYCFAAVSLWLPLGIALGSVMGTLILRGAYTHPFGRNGKRDEPANPWQYAMDSGTDSVMSVGSLLLSQSVMVMISTSLALRESMMWRGVVIFTPLMFVLRLVFRPRPDASMPFHGSNLTSDQIYKRTWLMNILWIATCHFTLVTNPHSLPDWLPQANILRGALPMNMFIVWFRIQANALIRRDYIETLFTDCEKKKKARHREVLMKGMDKSEPYYGLYVGLQWFLFLYLATPILFALWPWLAGTETSLDVFGIVFHVAALITLALTWNYLKAANRVAAAALEEDIVSSSRVPQA